MKNYVLEYSGKTENAAAAVGLLAEKLGMRIDFVGVHEYSDHYLMVRVMDNAFDQLDLAWDDIEDITDEHILGRFLEESLEGIAAE